MPFSSSIAEGALENVIGQLIDEEKGITEWVKSDRERMKKSEAEPCPVPE
jgi:hypothetical protein